MRRRLGFRSALVDKRRQANQKSEIDGIGK
jgi:hypothetical protein